MWLFLLFTGFKMCLAYWQHCNPLLCLLSWHPHHLSDMLLQCTGCHSRSLPALVTQLMYVCVRVWWGFKTRERRRETDRWTETERPQQRQRNNLYLSLWTALTAHGGNGKKDTDKDGNHKRKRGSLREIVKEAKIKKGIQEKEKENTKKWKRVLAARQIPLSTCNHLLQVSFCLASPRLATILQLTQSQAIKRLSLLLPPLPSFLFFLFTQTEKTLMFFQ